MQKEIGAKSSQDIAGLASVIMGPRKKGQIKAFVYIPILNKSFPVTFLFTDISLLELDYLVFKGGCLA